MIGRKGISRRARRPPCQWPCQLTEGASSAAAVEPFQHQLGPCFGLKPLPIFSKDFSPQPHGQKKMKFCSPFSSGPLIQNEPRTWSCRKAFLSR